MLVKAFRHIGIVIVAALVAVSCGVSKVKDIAVISFGVDYIVPTSTRSADAKLKLGIDNPAMAFAVQEITGAIKYNDKVIATFVTGGMELEGKAQQIYDLPCTVTLADGTSLLDVLVIASKQSLEGLKADFDVQAALKKNGVLRAPYSFRDVDISQFKN